MPTQPETGTIRAFVAVELPDDVLAHLGAVQRDLQKELGRVESAVRWVKPEGMHLTLQFLGDVPRAQLPDIEQALREAGAGARPTQVRTAGLGAFPNPNRARVIWIGLEGDLQPLFDVERAIGRALTPLGYRPDKPFKPHLTLGRVREHIRPEEAAALAQVLLLAPASKRPPNSSVFTADAVSLMQSTLQPGGAEYRELARIRIE
jgi:RNA 2',3'-cyclic 3'-phosphodiesterase